MISPFTKRRLKEEVAECEIAIIRQEIKACPNIAILYELREHLEFLKNKLDQ